MNLEESAGGSSCNGRENGDGFNGSERPLKKARFAWQVKGKYHLKNDTNDTGKISTSDSTVPEMAGSSGSGSNSSESKNMGTQDLKAIGKYLLNQDFNTVVDDDPDKPVIKPSLTVTDELFYYPRKVSSKENPVHNIFTPSSTVADEIIYYSKIASSHNPVHNIFTPSATDELKLNPRNISSQESTESEILKPTDVRIGSSQDLPSNHVLATHDHSHALESVPMSMVPPENYTEDQCIARWQARQIAKGPLDNTINRVLDYIKQNPLEEDNSTLQAFDVANFINNLPGINSIENEGILMAISAHGLQNTSNSSSSFNSFSSSMSLDFEELCDPTINGIMSPALRISFSPIHSDDESHDQSQGEFEYALDNVQWSYSDELKNEDSETIQSPTFHGTSSLTFQNLYENLHNTDAASNDVDIENDNHRDFLDAAVLFAIQSKGLTTFGTDYG